MFVLTRVLVLMALMAVLGCGGAGDDADTAGAADKTSGSTDDDTAVIQEAQDAPSDSLSDNFNFNDKPHLSEIDMGQFEALWPSGCGKTRTRAIERNAKTTEYIAVEAVCDCFGRKDLGVKVTAYLEMRDGTVPGPENVAVGIQSQIQALGLRVIKQVKAGRDGMEGVAVYCVQRDGVGVVWMEGYLYQGKILHAMAWGPDDSLYTNQEIVDFMRSVKFVEKYF